jgi:hypothetical protein
MLATVEPIIPALAGGGDDNRPWSSWWNKNAQEKLKNMEKTCPNDTLSITNPI